jgi:hypothetical protein
MSVVKQVRESVVPDLQGRRLGEAAGLSANFCPAGRARVAQAWGVRAAVMPLTFLAVAFVARPARACGVSTADGLSACSLAEHEEETRPHWRTGVAGLYTSTTIDFSGGLRSDETRGSIVASLAYQPTRRLTVQLAAGSTVGGHLDTPAGVYAFSPGPTGAAGVSYRLLPGTKPFVILTANLSFSAASTEPSGGTGPKVSYDAFDLRGGALVGTTLAGVLSPYAVARAFGGPIYWQYQGQSVTGTDAHHYQVGVGLTLVLARTIDLFAEGVPLGERSLAAGGAIAF